MESSSNPELTQMLEKLKLSTDTSLSDLKSKQIMWKQQVATIKNAKILEKQNEKLQMVQDAIDLMENPPKIMPQIVPQIIPQIVPQIIPQIVPQSIPQTIPQHAPHITPQPIPLTIPQHIPQVASQIIPLIPEIIETSFRVFESPQDDLAEQFKRGLAQEGLGGLDDRDQLEELLTIFQEELVEARSSTPYNISEQQGQVDRIKTLIHMRDKLYPSGEAQLEQLLRQLGLNDANQISEQIQRTAKKLIILKNNQDLKNTMENLNKALALATKYNLIKQDQNKKGEESKTETTPINPTPPLYPPLKDPIVGNSKIVQQDTRTPYSYSTSDQQVDKENEAPQEKISAAEEQKAALQEIETQNKKRRYQYFQGASRNFKVVQDMPPCFEKSLIFVLYYCSLQLSGERSIIDESTSDYSDIIRNETASLMKFYTEESIEKPDIKREIETLIDVSKSNSGLEQSIEIINRIIPKIRQFSFGEFLDLASQIGKTASRIENNHIILMLGKTGSGKTTTLQYLCGLQMILKKVNGLNHIEADNITNEDLKQLKCSPFAKSETRVVRMIEVNLKDLDHNQKSQTVHLVDTPGFDDTESAEIDVSNPLAIIKAISRAKSVRPVILLNWNAQGDRMNLWKAQIKFYCKIFKNIKDNVGSLNIFFTNVHASDKSQILPKLKDLQDTLNLEDQQDSDFNIVLTELLTKVTKRQAIVIDPLDGQPIEMMKIILKNEPIEYPGQAFQISTQNSSNEKVHEQFRIHQKMIEKAMRSNKPLIARYKIDELKNFTEYFIGSPESYSDRLVESLKSVGTYLSDNFKHAWANFSKCLQLGNTMNEDDVKTYIQQYENATSFEGIRRLYIKGDTESNDFYLTKIRLMLTEIAEVKMKDVEVNSNQWQELLSKSQLLKEHIGEFTDICELIENSFLKAFEKLFDNGRDLISKLTLVEEHEGPDFDVYLDRQRSGQEEMSMSQQHSNDFNFRGTTTVIRPSMAQYTTFSSDGQDYQCARLFKSMVQSECKIKNEALRSKIGKGIKKLMQMLLEQLKIQVQSCILKHAFKFDSKTLDLPTIPPTLLLDQDIKQLQQVMLFLYSFKQSFKRVSKDTDEAVSKAYDSSYRTLISMFEYHSNEIKKCLESKRIQFVDQSFQQLKKLRKVTYIEQATNQPFYQIQAVINGHVTFLINEVEKLLPNIINTKANKDPKLFRNLKEAIISINKLGSLVNEVSDASEYKTDFLEQNKLKLHDNINTYIDMIDSEVQGKYISIDRPADTEIISKAYVIRQDLIEVSKLVELTDIPQTQIVWATQLEQQFQRIVKDIEKMELQVIISIENAEEGKEQEIKKVSTVGKFLSLNDYRRLNCNITFLETLLESNPNIFCLGMGKTEIRDQLKQRIVDMLNEEYTRITDSFDNSFKYILKANREQNQSNDEFEELVQKETQNIITIFRNLSEISANVQVVYKFIQQEDESYYEDFIDKIDNIYISLKKELENSHTEGNQIKWECKIVVLKSVIKLDEYTKNTNLQSFKQLYEQTWLPVIIGNPAAIEVSAREHITQLEFFELNDLLAKQHQLNTVQSRQNFSQIRKILNKEIQEMSKEINGYFNSASQGLSEKQAEILNAKANCLEKIRNQISEEFYDSKSKIEQILTNFYDRVQKEILNLLSQAEKQFQSFNIGYSRQLLQLSKSILSKVTTDINCDIQCENQWFQLPVKEKLRIDIEKLEWDMDHFILSYVDLISNGNGDLSQFKDLQPRPQKLLENLYQCMQEQIVSQWIQQIEEALEDFFKEQIEEIQLIFEQDQLTKEAQKQINELQKLAAFSCKKIEQNLILMFDSVHENIADKVEEDNVKVQALQSIKNIDQFKIHPLIVSSNYESNPNVSAWINQQFQKLCEEGLIYLEKGELNKVMDKIIPELEKYQDQKFEKLLESTSLSQKEELLNQIQDFIMKIFQTVINEITIIDDSIVIDDSNSYKGLSSDDGDADDQYSDSVSLSNLKKKFTDTKTQFNLTGLSGSSFKNNMDYVIRIDNIQKLNQLLNTNFVEECIDELIQSSISITSQLQTQFNQALMNQSITELIEIIKNCKTIQKIFNNLKKQGIVRTLKAFQENEDRRLFSQIIQNERYFEKEILCDLKGLVIDRSERLNHLLLLVDFQKDQQSIDEQFSKANDEYKQLNSLLQMGQEIKEICQIDLNLKLVSIENNYYQALDIHESDLKKVAANLGKSIQPEIIKRFNIIYKNLKGLSKNLSLGKEKLLIKMEKINQAIDQSLGDLFEKARRDPDHENVSQILITLWKISELIEIEEIQEKARNYSNEILVDYKLKNRKNAQEAISNLYVQLSEDPTGSAIVSSNSIFKGAERFKFNTKFREPKFDIILRELRGDNIDINQLRDSYKRYKNTYKATVNQFLDERRKKQQEKPNFQYLVEQVQNLAKSPPGNWTQTHINKLPDLLASIFALQTCLNDESYMDCDKTLTESERKKYLWKPRKAQIIGIFRSLGIGYSQWNFTQSPLNYLKNKVFGSKESSIKDNFVQIKTGEGKSVTLAAVSIIFALHGFEAHCGCYSSYLSQRDYEAFLPLFNVLGLKDYIKYGEFNQLCEGILNQEGDIRSAYLQEILSPEYQYLNEFESEPREQRKCVLIIDEVDVFFGKDFYGQVYNPRLDITCDEISNLIDLIWQNRKITDINTLEELVRTSDEYQYAIEVFNPEFLFILDGAILKMIATLMHIDSHKFECQNGKIGYKTIDSVDYTEKRDYFTMWAYYVKNEEGLVYAQDFENSKSIIVICGQYSYSEIPFLYHLMVGVSGTLETLTKSEQNIVKNIYNIQNMTYLPSIFASSNFTLVPTIILKQNFYYIELTNEIKRCLRSNQQQADNQSEYKRAVLVFFKNIKELTKYEQSQEFKCLAMQSQKIIETLTNAEKESRVSLSSRQGTITLCTRIFGRGTDFICRDQVVNDNGGVAVIQTFYTETESEEIQIKGRTARQGTKGSYQKVLLENDLSEFNVTPQEIDSWNKSEYDIKLIDKRNLRMQQKQGMDTANLDQLKQKHITSLENLKKIIQSNADSKVIEFIKSLNEVPESKQIKNSNEIVRTLLLFDATGSMSGMLTNTKNSIQTMYDRAKDVLKTKKVSQNQFEIQLACYRNYSSGPEVILEHSDWGQNSQVLSQFLNNIDVSGGQGNEAIEIGLQYANSIASVQNQKLTQIFLIGDMPPNTQNEVKSKRNDSGHTWTGLYKNETFYKEEYALLIQKKIPIFSFYVEQYKSTIDAFTEIATQTGGTCNFLDVNNIEEGQKLLIDSFVEQILARVAVAVGLNPQDLIQQYQKSYGRK